MADQLIPRAPKHKKQPTAEQLRHQLALAADEIIRQRRLIDISSVYSEEPVFIVDPPFADPLPPPTPPSCRIEYSSIFGRRMFDSVQQFEDWLVKPWWRRIFRSKKP